MKNINFLNVLLIAATVSLASCGGGGDIGDGTQKLAASPSKIDLESPYCSYASGPTVTVYGGIAPYRISNPYPAYISLDKNYISKAGDTFSFSVHGACLTTVPILIYDADGNTLEFNVSLKDNAPVQ